MKKPKRSELCIRGQVFDLGKVSDVARIARMLGLPKEETAASIRKALGVVYGRHSLHRDRQRT